MTHTTRPVPSGAWGAWLAVVFVVHFLLPESSAVTEDAIHVVNCILILVCPHGNKPSRIMMNIKWSTGRIVGGIEGDAEILLALWDQIVSGKHRQEVRNESSV